MAHLQLRSEEIEAANRGEATALLIRCGYRVYRPEADIEGEDMLVCTPTGRYRRVQLKGRMLVNWQRYGGRNLWMLFPSQPFQAGKARQWYLVPHDMLYQWQHERHGHASSWKGAWSSRSISKQVATLLRRYEVKLASEVGKVRAEHRPPEADSPKGPRSA